MQLLTRILLDFGDNSCTPTVYAKRRDSKSRYIAITPYNNGEDLELTDGITARIHLTKPDGHTVFNDCIISDNEIRVELTAQILSVEGLAVAEIGLYEGEALLSSQNFFINIDASAFDENAPESSDEFNALVEALASVKNSAEIAENAAEAAQEAILTAEKAAENATAAANAANSASARVENAAEKLHSHENAEVINKFSEDDEGNPLYDGNSIGGVADEQIASAVETYLNDNPVSGITDEQAADLVANTEARHEHENKAHVLDHFGLNYASNRPTFKGNNNILALLSDIDDKIRQQVNGVYAKPADILVAVESALTEAKENGEFDGNDGFSPIVNVTEIEGGHRVTITDAEDTEIFDVLDGEKGDPYTLTESDKETIVNAVLKALPVAEGVGF